jgi:hypothetical protein
MEIEGRRLGESDIGHWVTRIRGRIDDNGTFCNHVGSIGILESVRRDEDGEVTGYQYMYPTSIYYKYRRLAEDRHEHFFSIVSSIQSNTYTGERSHTSVGSKSLDGWVNLDDLDDETKKEMCDKGLKWVHNQFPDEKVYLAATDDVIVNGVHY